MANPKHRHSKARTRSRRAMYKVKSTPETMECPNCGNAKIRHRACPTCGNYRGRQVVERKDYA